LHDAMASLLPHEAKAMFLKDSAGVTSGHAAQFRQR
jgi:hypothetical protein